MCNEKVDFKKFYEKYKEHIDDLIEICTDSQRMEFKAFIKEQNLFSPNMNKKQ